MNYIKTYCDYFNYVYDDYIPSELSGQQSSDVHHIIFRSKQGSDDIDNLIALTREEHNKAHSGELSVEFLQKIHKRFKSNYDKRN